MKQLIKELKEVVEWRSLGEELGMSAQLLQEIESSNKENEHKKRAMIRWPRLVSTHKHMTVLHAGLTLTSGILQQINTELRLLLLCDGKPHAAQACTCC